ncbi:MAG: dienelactone hydrolase family protein [Firmicutes bacterium]|nr:dienelactone hydrolase family protein [Bacillota bacterium]
MSTCKSKGFCKENEQFLCLKNNNNSILLKKLTLNNLLLNFLTALLLIFFAITAKPAAAQNTVKIKSENFSFTSNNRQIRGAAFYPDAPGKYPGVLVINGNPESFAKEGFFAVTLQSDDDKDYRIAIDKMTNHQNCKPGIGITGFSYGGALSLVLAAKNPKVKAVVEVSGLLVPQNNIDLTKDIQAAVMFISGEKDPMVPVSGTRKMFEEHKKTGKPSDIYIVPNQGHGFTPEYNIIVFRKSVEFFRKNLK